MPVVNTNGSVVKEPLTGASDALYSLGDTYSVMFQMAEAADSMPIWGAQPGYRDRALRAFWPTENWFASALYSTVGRYAAFGWSLEGPPRTVQAVQRLLHTAEGGQGWIPFVTKLLIDLYTQDNGAFIEVVRAERGNPSSPPIGLNHLDSGRCVRTGRAATPVVYYDIQGSGHELQWFEVIPLSEFPSPIESMRGVQFCALTRILRHAQIMKEVSILKKEKVSGRFTRQLHLIGGMPTSMIEDAIRKHQSNADAQGLMRYITPVVIGSLDPTANVSHAQIDLAGLPDGWNEEEAMKWYITHMALAFGSEYQEFAPMMGNHLGSGRQAQVSMAKTRGKGPALFMRTLEYNFNFLGVMPRSTTFSFSEQDLGEQYENILVKKERALWLNTLILAGVITTQVARQIAVDHGDLDARYLLMMQEQDATATTTRADSGTPALDPGSDQPAFVGEPGPLAPPSPMGGGGAPPNNNADRTKPPSHSQASKVV